jgi:hypothetical protein
MIQLTIRWSEHHIRIQGPVFPGYPPNATATNMSIKDILIQALRSVLGVFLGLMLISLIAEGIEFLLVALVHGSITTDQEVYFEIRNRPALLGIKFIYNSVAGLAGGYVTAWIASRAPIWHGVFLAAVQLSGFIYGMTASPYASTTPMWAWIGLAGTMTPMIVFGSWLRCRRATPMIEADTDTSSDQKRG